MTQSEVQLTAVRSTYTCVVRKTGLKIFCSVSDKKPKLCVSFSELKPLSEFCERITEFDFVVIGSKVVLVGLDKVMKQLYILQIDDYTQSMDVCPLSPILEQPSSIAVYVCQDRLSVFFLDGSYIKHGHISLTETQDTLTVVNVLHDESADRSMLAICAIPNRPTEFSQKTVKNGRNDQARNRARQERGRDSSLRLYRQIDGYLGSRHSVAYDRRFPLQFQHSDSFTEQLRKGWLNHRFTIRETLHRHSRVNARRKSLIRSFNVPCIFGPLRDARFWGCAGQHTFCSFCIANIVRSEGGRHCPHCRSLMRKRKFDRNPWIQPQLALAFNSKCSCSQLVTLFCNQCKELGCHECHARHNWITLQKKDDEVSVEIQQAKNEAWLWLDELEDFMSKHQTGVRYHLIAKEILEDSIRKEYSNRGEPFRAGQHLILRGIKENLELYRVYEAIYEVFQNLKRNKLGNLFLGSQSLEAKLEDQVQYRELLQKGKDLHDIIVNKKIPWLCIGQAVEDVVKHNECVLLGGFDVNDRDLTGSKLWAEENLHTLRSEFVVLCPDGTTYRSVDRSTTHTGSDHTTSEVVYKSENNRRTLLFHSHPKEMRNVTCKEGLRLELTRTRLTLLTLVGQRNHAHFTREGVLESGALQIAKLMATHPTP